MSIGADTKSTFYREDFMQQISVKKLINGIVACFNILGLITRQKYVALLSKYYLESYNSFDL